ncbi:hypothetical protein CCP4SC76_8120003 [Gammaproteobacteria bacterium]
MELAEKNGKFIVCTGFPMTRKIGNAPNIKSKLDAFKVALGYTPEVFTKRETKETDWITKNAANAYLTLRRTVIDACDKLLEILEKDDTASLRINDLIEDSKALRPQEVEDWLTTLRDLLPAEEPTDERRAEWLRLWLRTLVHDFERVDYKKIKQLEWEKSTDCFLTGFARILKITRNWASHSKLTFQALDIGDIAYLTILTMRVYFNLDDGIQSFEERLLKIVEPNPGLTNTFNPPFARVYKEALKCLRSHQSRLYSEIIADLQEYREMNLPSDQLIRGLYRMFWFVPVKQEICLDDPVSNTLSLEFIPWKNHLQPGDEHYTRTLARHLYKASFGYS